MFNPPKFKCKNCGVIVQSKAPGHFSACDCFENSVDNKGIAVDYTEHYGRHIGHQENFISIEENVCLTQ